MLKPGSSVQFCSSCIEKSHNRDVLNLLIRLYCTFKFLLILFQFLFDFFFQTFMLMAATSLLDNRIWIGLYIINSETLIVSSWQEETQTIKTIDVSVTYWKWWDVKGQKRLQVIIQPFWGWVTLNHSDSRNQQWIRVLQSSLKYSWKVLVSKEMKSKTLSQRQASSGSFTDSLGAVSEWLPYNPSGGTLSGPLLFHTIKWMSEGPC